MDYTRIGNIKLITQGDSVIATMKRRGYFETEALKIWNDIASSKSGMVDVGMYTGLYAISASLAGATAYGFEPNPFAFKRAIENSILNNVSFISFPNALSDENKLETLYIPGGRKFSSACTLLPRDGTAIKVVARTLDSYNLDEIKCIKIDVERTESRVLKGALETIKRYKPVIIIELLRQPLYDEAFSILIDLDYKFTALGQALYLIEPKG